MCDTSHLKEHRALYWAIHKYHKDKPTKTKSAPVAGVTPGRGGNGVKGGKAKNVSSPKVKPQLNGVKPVIKHKLLSSKQAVSPASINSVYNKLQKNGAINIAPVKHVQNRINGVNSSGNKKNKKKELPEHFVDLMLKDADECIEQFINMVGEVKKMWKVSGKKKADITGSTKKLRKILELAKQNIAEVDQKVVDSYIYNVSDADIMDISFEDRENNIDKKLKVFSNDESTPDLATRDVNSAGTGSNTNPRDSGKKAIKGAKEKSIMNGYREVDTELKMINPDSEEGISDMSVDELEGENQECQKAFVKPVKETQTERNKLGDIQEKINECSKEYTNNELKIEQVNTAFDLELPLSKTVEYDIVKSKTNAYSPDSTVVESEGKRKENTTESIDSIKEEKVDVREIQKSVSILSGSTLNSNESVETNKMDAGSFQEDKEMIHRNESSTGDTDNEKSTPASLELKAEHTNTALISVASEERRKEKITENFDSIKEDKDAEKADSQNILKTPEKSKIEYLTSTPRQREYFKRTMGIQTPSPLVKRRKISSEEMRAFSLIVHAFAQKELGSIKKLYEVGKLSEISL